MLLGEKKFMSCSFPLSMCSCGIPRRLFYQYFILGIFREFGGEGNGNPLQYSCLENPMDRGTWWAMVHSVPKSRAQLKQLSVHREFGMGMYPLLYLKWIINKVLLYNTWKSAQCYVAAWMEGTFGEEWIHVYMWLSPFTVYWKLLQHDLLITFTQIKNLKKLIMLET